VKLYCGSCEKEKFAGLFSPAMRKMASDQQRRCLKCVREKGRVERKRNRPSNVLDHGWRDSNAIFFRRQEG